MKKILVILMFLITIGVFADYHQSTIGVINFYGGEWGNSHSGGVLFTLDSMPEGISYFRIDNNDIALRNLISVLMLGYSSDLEIRVAYDPNNKNVHGYCYISMIQFPNK